MYWRTCIPQNVQSTICNLGASIWKVSLKDPDVWLELPILVLLKGQCFKTLFFKATLISCIFNKKVFFSFHTFFPLMGNEKSLN